MTSSERLVRRARLTGAEDFRRITGRGTRHRAGVLDFAWVANDVGHPRLGLVVPKFRSSAVARNRLRRRLRETLRRLVLPKLRSVDLVVRARPAAYVASAGQLTAEVLGWLETRAPRAIH